MSRPIYETEQDLEREREVVSRVEDFSLLRAVKLPRSYNLDYLLVDSENVPRIAVEVKCRRRHFGRFPTYMISAAKVQHALELEKALRVRAVLVVDFEGDTRWIYFEDIYCKGSVSVGGRTDRSDWQDVEPVYLIPEDDASWQPVRVEASSPR